MALYKYLYKVILPKTNEFYIGSRSSKIEPELDIKYKGSMKTWKVDKSLLIKEILVKFPENTNHETLIEHESDLIGLVIDHPLNRNYHIPNKGFHSAGMKHTPEAIAKISYASRNISDATKEKIRKANTGKKRTQETKDKLRKANTGKIQTQEAKDKVGNANRGKKKPPRTDEHRQHIKESAVHRKPISEESRQKMSMSAKNRIRTPLSEETKIKIGLANKGRKLPPISEETRMKMSKTRTGVKRPQSVIDKMKATKNKNKNNGN